MQARLRKMHFLKQATMTTVQLNTSYDTLQSEATIANRRKV